MTDTQIEYIKSCKTALEMMKTLDNIYDAKSTTMQVHYIEKLNELKMTSFKTV